MKKSKLTHLNTAPSIQLLLRNQSTMAGLLLMQKHQVKTIEFKLDLNKSQRLTIDSWLDSMRWVWNEGLGLLLEYHSFKYYDWAKKTVEKQGYSFDGVDLRRVEFSRKAFAATCRIGFGSGDRIYSVEPIRLPEKPRLDVDNYLGSKGKKGLAGWMTKSNYPDQPQIDGVPMVFVKGTLKNLFESWKAYKDKSQAKRYIPKFKSKRKGDNVKSLYCLQPEAIKTKGDRIKCPGIDVLGSLKVVNKGLSKRWCEFIQPRTLKICKRASGYYLQLTGNFPVKSAKPSNKACGLDVGLQFIYSDDAGKQVNPPKYYRKAEKRLRRHQRKVARQVSNSKNQQKTKKTVAKLHEKVANQRRNFNHKLSTYLVRTFGAIAVEDIQIANLNRRPKPKKRADGDGYERNNAKAKSGLNKSFADAGLGQLLAMIEAKSKPANREFIKVAPHYTSQDCPQCGHRQKKSLSQRTHRCESCGYVAPRDHAAAQVIKAKADFLGSYRTCVRKVKLVKDLDKRSVQREPSLEGHGGDVATTFKNSQNNCAQQEVFKTCNQENDLQPGSDKRVGNDLGLSLPGAKPETLTCIGINPILQTPKMQRKRSKTKKSSSQSRSPDGTQLELDLWGTAPETRSDE